MDKTYILAPIFGIITLLIMLVIMFYALGFDEIYAQLQLIG